MRKLIALVPSFALLACGGGDKPVVDPTTTAQTTTTATASASSTTPTPPSAAGTSAYSFVIGAAGCWLGGSWAEAEGETQKAERKKAVEARCADVSKMLTGSPDKVEQLRALEPAITDSMGARVIEFAKNDHLDAAHTENLVKLVTAVGTAQREALLARRASEKIKGDLDKLSTDKEEDAAREKDSDKLTADEAGIVAQLKPTAALEALMNLQAGDYSHDGKAIALLTHKASKDESNAKKGFYLQIEGALIDKRSHANDAAQTLGEMKAFDDAVKIAKDFATKDGNTLVIVTADHECAGFNIIEKGTFTNAEASAPPANVDSGNTANNSTPIRPRNSKDATRSTGIVNGAGSTDPKNFGPATFRIPTDAADVVDGSPEASLWLSYLSGNHTGADVPVYAYGPGSDQLDGTIDNIALFGIVGHALKLVS